MLAITTWLAKKYIQAVSVCVCFGVFLPRLIKNELMRLQFLFGCQWWPPLLTSFVHGLLVDKYEVSGVIWWHHCPLCTFHWPVTTAGSLKGARHCHTYHQAIRIFLYRPPAITEQLITSGFSFFPGFRTQRLVSGSVEQWRNRHPP